LCGDVIRKSNICKLLVSIHIGRLLAEQLKFRLQLSLLFLLLPI
jgi:hypothetical protein